LTRDFRGLTPWLPLHLHGVDAFRAALDEKLDLAEYPLSMVAFRCRPGPDRDRHKRRSSRRRHGSRRVHRRGAAPVNVERRVLLSSTRIDGRLVGRASILNHRTDRARLDEALDAIRRRAAALRPR
jgi:aromatic-L-amino-acid decarboxylase